MKSVKRIWTKEELTIAFYYAKWDLNGLDITEDEIVDAVIGRTTKPSLKMQAANFRYILGIDGPQLKDASDAMYDLVEEYKNKTCTQMRNLVKEIIVENGVDLDLHKVKAGNKIAEEKKAQANRDEAARFEAKMLNFKKMGRNLRKK